MFKINRSIAAKYWIPSEDEWYKAAFYDPTLNGGIGGYWKYATRSNIDPISVTANSIGDGSAGDTGNFANYNRDAIWNIANGNVTTVGTNGGPSYYGTFDQSGNITEWNDSINNYKSRIGGDWQDTFGYDISSNGRRTTNNQPTFSGTDLGFRVSTLNDPVGIGNFVSVDNINNANDINGYGSVSYNYRIGKYEVTNNEYAEFLNAIASTDSFEVYDETMNTSPRGGIIRNGSSGDYTYSIKNYMDNKPVIMITWFRAARYCNWLHNGKPSGLQNKYTTEDGAYTLNGINDGIITKNIAFKLQSNDNIVKIKKV